MKRGAIDSFFQPKAKVARRESNISASGQNEAISEDAVATEAGSSQKPPSIHSTYPCPINQLPPELLSVFDFLPACDEGRAINNQPDLDLLYYAPFFPKPANRQLFKFLRASLPFYRVKYTIKRGGFETQINTPRWTTVFGLDATSKFSDDKLTVLDTHTGKPVAKDKYKCSPRPIPECLDVLRRATEAVTGETYNFVLVNYYATGADSISYHSDDEKFLGPNPAIASFSLGAKRDFLMKHKPPPPSVESGGKNESSSARKEQPLKLALASGDMVLMRGPTQSNWLHSIPKRKGGDADEGRINITLRKAMVKYGTENYNQYNVGNGPPYRWNEQKGEMVVMEGFTE